MAEDTRARILDACAEVIARSGLARFRMSDVAREAGVSIGLLAYHFGDRDGLLEAALDEVTAGAARRADGRRGSRTPSERLSALLRSEFGESPGIRAGSIVWNELRAAAVFDAARAAAVARATASWQRLVRELLAEAASEIGAEVDAEAGSLALTALVEGLSGRWLSGQITAEQAQATVEAALAALGFEEQTPA